MALHDGLLGREAHGEKALFSFGFAELLALLRQQQPVEEVLAEPVVHLLDARGFEHVDADPEDHRRAPCISTFMSRTAASRPVKMARPMMQWPMLSSTISGIAATGITLL
jgi:hypothetical protein